MATRRAPDFTSVAGGAAGGAAGGEEPGRRRV
jgi:hypothetical protein